MTLSSTTSLSLEAFKAELYGFLKPSENDHLFKGVATGVNADKARVHNDGANIPTLGYGFNLGAASYAEIEAGFRHAIGATGGTLAADQSSALAIVADYKAGLYTDLQMIGMSTGTHGTAEQQRVLLSLALTDASATRLLDYMVFYDVGQFSRAYNDAPNSRYGLSAFLGETADLPLSYERVAILDAFYNSPGLIGDSVRNPLRKDEREKVWFELRYDRKMFSDKDRDGIQDPGEGTLRGLVTRRVEETDMFGLVPRGTVNETEKLEEAKIALDFLFDGTFSDGSIYQRIMARDGMIANNPDTADDSFRKEIEPLLTLIATRFEFDGELHRVQVDDEKNSAALGAKAANDLKLVTNATNNAIFGEDGNDTLAGAGGHDLLVGGIGADSLFGGAGNDRLLGEVHNDRLDGGAGNDALFGGDGADSLNGGVGNDTLEGGGGSDRFVLGVGADIVSDFRSGGTVIDFEDAIVGTEDFITAYRGMSFSGFYALTTGAPTFRGGYAAVLTSGETVGLNGYAQGANFSSTSNFAFKGAQFAAAWNNGLQVTVRGYDDGVLVATKNFTLNYANRVEITFDGGFGSVDRVSFESGGGTDGSEADGYGGSHVAMDDLILGVPVGTEPDRIVMPAGATASRLIATATSEAGNAVLHWGANSLTLVGIQKSALVEDWFMA